MLPNRYGNFSNWNLGIGGNPEGLLDTYNAPGIGWSSDEQIIFTNGVGFRFL